MKINLARATEVYQRDGLRALVKEGLAFLNVYRRNQFYLYECPLVHRNESDFIPRIKNFEFKIVSTQEQWDELIEQGRKILAHSNRTARRLGSGAVCFLVFVGQELAASGWVATTRKAQASIFQFPYRIDFSKGEACIESAWTNPKFRRSGLQTYLIYKRQAFLREQGKTLTRSAIAAANMGSRRAHEKFKPRAKIYAKASYLKLLGISFWNETRPSTPPMHPVSVLAFFGRAGRRPAHGPAASDLPKPPSPGTVACASARHAREKQAH